MAKRELTEMQKAARLVVGHNGPFGWGRACPFCMFHVSHRKVRGGGSTWGLVAKANSVVARHIVESHPDKMQAKQAA